MKNRRIGWVIIVLIEAMRGAKGNVSTVFHYTSVNGKWPCEKDVH